MQKLQKNHMSYPEFMDTTNAIIERLLLPENEDALCYAIQEERNDNDLLNSLCNWNRTDWNGGSAQALAVYILELDNDEKHDFDEYALALWLNENQPLEVVA